MIPSSNTTRIGRSSANSTATAPRSDLDPVLRISLITRFTVQLFPACYAGNSCTEESALSRAVNLINDTLEHTLDLRTQDDEDPNNEDGDQPDDQAVLHGGRTGLITEYPLFGHKEERLQRSIERQHYLSLLVEPQHMTMGQESIAGGSG